MTVGIYVKDDGRNIESRAVEFARRTIEIARKGMRKQLFEMQMDQHFRNENGKTESESGSNVW